MHAYDVAAGEAGMGEHKVGVYSARSLRGALRVFEERFGVSTDVFMDAYRSGRSISGISGFYANVWASMAEDVERMLPAHPTLPQTDDGAYVEHVRRSLAVA